MVDANPALDGFVHGPVSRMLGTVLLLAPLGSVSLERFFVRSSIGLLIVAELPAPFTVTPAWRHPRSVIALEAPSTAAFGLCDPGRSGSSDVRDPIESDPDVDAGRDTSTGCGASRSVGDGVANGARSAHCPWPDRTVMRSTRSIERTPAAVSNFPADPCRKRIDQKTNISVPSFAVICNHFRRSSSPPAKEPDSGR